ncbi:MAG: protein rep [Acidimicrobiia bacterium]|nr:protein rep [Acidimicrobiia bacterium]
MTDEQVAHITGFQTCGSIHACPVCASKIRAVRADEISEGARRWLGDGHELAMLTLTMPHDVSMSLEEVWDTVADGWRAVQQGRGGQMMRQSMAGFIRSADLTYGEHGWHFHLHVLVFLEPGESWTEGMTERLRDAWDRWLIRRGYSAAHRMHGVDVRPVRDDAGIGEYVSKVAMELARPDRKEGRGGRTVWEILGDIVEHRRPEDEALWCEYVRASHGRRALTWSQGLRRRVLDLEDDDVPTDDEIAAQEQDAPYVALLGPGLMRLSGEDVEVHIAILEGAEADGAVGIEARLAEAGIPVRITWVVRDGAEIPEFEVDDP